MNSVKILHCADIHLDAPLSGLPIQLAEIRQEELRQTFGKMIDVAKQENVDIFLISGDLFDHEQVKKTTIDYLINKFRSISHIPITMVAGNHDSLSKSYYYNKEIWPDNVHIFGKEIGCISFSELNLCVYGKSFYQPYEEDNCLKDFSIEEESKINIMMMHGEITSKGSQSRYNPITLDDIKNSRLDYLALGHVHKFSGINKIGNTYWSYPGTPEGKGFDELGEKGFVIGEVYKGYAQLEFKKINKREYIEIVIDVTDVTTYEEITEKVKKAIGKDIEQNIYKLILKGDISEDFNIHTDIIHNSLKDDVYQLKIINETSFSIQLDNDLVEDTLKNVFINNIKKKMTEAYEKEDIYKRALKIGISALNGERIDFHEDN